MNVQQLIDVLQKIEDKSLKVHFSYDSRAAGRAIHCVDLAYGRKGNQYVVFREESTEDYHHYNPNYDKLTDGEYAKQKHEKELNWYLTEMVRMYPGKTTDQLKEMAHDSAEQAIRHRRINKRDTSDDVNLYLEDPES